MFTNPFKKRADTARAKVREKLAKSRKQKQVAKALDTVSDTVPQVTAPAPKAKAEKPKPDREVVGPFSYVPDRQKEPIDAEVKATAIEMLQAMGEDQGQGRSGRSAMLVDKAYKPGMTAEDLFKAAYRKDKPPAPKVPKVKKSEHSFSTAYIAALHACNSGQIETPSVRAFTAFTNNSQSMANSVAKKLFAEGIISRTSTGRYCWPDEEKGTAA